MTNSPQSCSAASEGAWLLVKRGLFYRPNNSGYTGLRDEAGRYSREDADKHMAAGGKAMREADAPEFMPEAYSDVVLKRLAEQRDEARQLVIEANNSLYGSQGYFHSLNGGPFDKYHLSRGIEDLKAANRRMNGVAQPVLPSREAIAAIINPAAFKDDPNDVGGWLSFRDRALAKADAILALAAQPPAAPVETKSAPVSSAPHNSGERLPSSDAADAGAGAQCSAGSVTAADLKALYEWMREPDWAEEFSINDMAEWINKRPSNTARLLAEGAPIEPQTPLIKGAVYNLGRFGPAEYVGLDEYHGETTHKFLTSDRRPRYIKPDELSSLLSRPLSRGGE